MRHVDRLITKHFVEGLSAEERSRMWEHLRDCSRCRAEYDRRAELLRAVAGEVPTRAEARSLHQSLLVELAADQAPARRPVRRWIPRLLPALSAALVVVVVSVGISSLGPPERNDRSEKGGPAGLGLHAELELFAVAEPSPGRFSDPRAVPEGAALGLDEYVQFRYQHGGPGLRYLYLFGLDSRLIPLDYFPRPDREVSIPAAEVGRMATVGPSIRLAKRHLAGPLQIVALFSIRPLERREVHARVTQARIRGVQAAFLDKIDFGPETTVVVKRFQVVEHGER
jgi:hypothetical protein